MLLPLGNPFKWHGEVLSLQPMIPPKRFAISVRANTGFYGDKILYENLHLTQDSPNKILFHFLWEQNIVQKSAKIFRWSEMCSLGKMLAQDFQMAAVTKILMRRDKSIPPLLSLGDNQKTLETQKRTR